MLHLCERPDGHTTDRDRERKRKKEKRKKPNTRRDLNPWALCHEACALPLCYNRCLLEVRMTHFSLNHSDHSVEGFVDRIDDAAPLVVLRHDEPKFCNKWIIQRQVVHTQVHWLALSGVEMITWNGESPSKGGDESVKASEGVSLPRLPSRMDKAHNQLIQVWRMVLWFIFRLEVDQVTRSPGRALPYIFLSLFFLQYYLEVLDGFDQLLSFSTVQCQN